MATITPDVEISKTKNVLKEVTTQDLLDEIRRRNKEVVICEECDTVTDVDEAEYIEFTDEDNPSKIYQAPVCTDCAKQCGHCRQYFSDKSSIGHDSCYMDCEMEPDNACDDCKGDMKVCHCEELVPRSRENEHVACEDQCIKDPDNACDACLKRNENNRKKRRKTSQAAAIAMGGSEG